MTAGWRRWLRIWRRTPETDVEAELRFHIDARVEDLTARGAAPDAARAQALEEFGDLETTRTVLGAIDRRIAGRHQRAEWWEAVAQDLRHTLRGLARTPAFTVMVVVTLALGIGANAAVFSVLNRLYFAAPAGVVQPEQVRRIYGSLRFPGRPTPEIESVFSYPEYRGIAAVQPAGVRVAGSVPGELPYGFGPSAPTHAVEYSVGDYLGLLGLHPVIGRFFSGAELQVTGLTPVAVISRRLWERDFGGTSDVLGKPLDLGLHRYTIIGVVPARFHGTRLDDVDIWLPFNAWAPWVGRTPDWYEQTGTSMIRALARLPSVVPAEAVAAAAGQGLRTDGVLWDSTAAAVTAPLRGAGDAGFFDRQEIIAQRLALVAALILLIACANVTNLTLGRTLARRHETAIRLALGVSRHRLVLQMLTESLVVALLAGAAAGGAAIWGAASLRHIVLPNVAWGPASFSGSVGWFAAAVSLAVGLAVGILPAAQGTRPDLTNALRQDTRGAGRSSGRVRSSLVIVQAGLSVVLLAGAGLFVRSLQRVESIDLGYDVPNILFVSPRAGEDTATGRALDAALPQLAERMARAPGVERTALMFMPPMWGVSWIDTYLPDRDSLPGESGNGPPYVLLGTPGFLTTLGVHLVAGRFFTVADRKGSEPVLVVNQALAQAYWPGQSALGKCLILEKRSDPCRRVIGVVENVHMGYVTEKPSPAYFVPLGQAPANRRAGTIALRVPASRQPAARAAVAGILRDAFGSSVRPGIQSMDDITAPRYRRWRAGAVLFSLAGLLALLVAAVGIYSTMAYSVNLRTREIGIRMALGARATNVARLIVGQGVRVVIIGIVLGTLVALAAGRLVASLLYDVSPHDPLVLVMTALTLLAVAIAACFIPARRAARVDPMETLRAE